VETMTSMLTAPVSSNATPARKLRDLEEKMTSKIESLRGNRLENTPKRQCQAMSARCEAANLERVQRALLALAKGWDTGSVPAELRKLTTRAAIEPLVTRIIEHPSYYVVCESDKWRSMEPIAVQLRAFVAEMEGADGAARDAANASAARIRRLEEEIRFTPIDGFFPTPPELIARMIELAEIAPGMRVFEPSAGKGDIVEAVMKTGAGCCGLELVSKLAELCNAKGLSVVCRDFMQEKPSPCMDRVLMNPPFEKGQDMAHVQRAFEWLKPGGKLVAIVSASFTFRSTEQARAFNRWLFSVKAETIKNDPDAFRNAFRSTGVQTWTLVIDKPE